MTSMNICIYKSIIADIRLVSGHLAYESVGIIIIVPDATEALRG